MKSIKLLGALVLVFLAITIFCGSTFGQTNVNEEQGLKPYDSWHGGDLDSVSLTSGGLVLHIGLVSFPQRGNMPLDFALRYSSKQWQIRTFCSAGNPDLCNSRWQPSLAGGAQVVSSVDWWQQYSSTPDGAGSDWSLGALSPDGNRHEFGVVMGGPDPVYPLRSLDATGLLFLDANTLILPNGTRLSYLNGVGQAASGGKQPASITDANGNRITISTSGWTDTLGRFIPGSTGGSSVGPGVPTSDLSTCPSGTSSAQIWNTPGVAGVNGGIRSFKFCYSTVTLSTNFHITGVLDYPATNTPLLSAIVLPDLTMWTLSYDSYGQVTRLGFPTGGSISYTYVAGPANCSQGTTQSMAVASRTVDANDGTGGHTWNYSYALQSGTFNVVATLTTPEGNQSVHTATNPVSRIGSCGLYETQVQYYQGTTSTGTLLKTVSTQYSGNATGSESGDGTFLDINVVPTQVTVSLPGGHTSKIVNAYDATSTNSYGDPVMIGSLLQKDEYDFSSSLVRSTLHHYLWQDNTTYKTNNFVKLMASTTLQDALGNQMSKTTHGYDEVAVTASGIGTSLVAPPAGGNIRGNVTTVSHWLNTTNSFISNTATYFDTGMKASSTDPKGNTTTYAYSSAFAGAYMTQTNLPNTQMPESGAPIVHHVISGNYDFNTGLLTSFIDQNSQTYSYQYDNMLRLTQGNHPDGGQTLLTYPSTTQVERRRLISGSVYDDFKVNFDGLGRPVQSQQATPSGPF